MECHYLRLYLPSDSVSIWKMIEILCLWRLSPLCPAQRWTRLAERSFDSEMSKLEKSWANRCETPIIYDKNQGEKSFWSLKQPHEVFRSFFPRTREGFCCILGTWITLGGRADWCEAKCAPELFSPWFLDRLSWDFQRLTIWLLEIQISLSKHSNRNVACFFNIPCQRFIGQTALLNALRRVCISRFNLVSFSQ